MLKKTEFNYCQPHQWHVKHFDVVYNVKSREKSKHSISVKSKGNFFGTSTAKGATISLKSLRLIWINLLPKILWVFYFPLKTEHILQQLWRLTDKPPAAFLWEFSISVGRDPARWCAPGLWSCVTTGTGRPNTHGSETGSKGEIQLPADIGLHWNRVKRRITATSWHWSSLKQYQKENYSNQLKLVFIETGSKGEIQQPAHIGLHWNRVKRRNTATSWHWSSLKQGQKENYSNQLTLVLIETGSKGELQQPADIGLHWNRVKRRITATSWHWSSLKHC